MTSGRTTRSIDLADVVGTEGAARLVMRDGERIPLAERHTDAVQGWLSQKLDNHRRRYNTGSPDEVPAAMRALQRQRQRE